MSITSGGTPGPRLAEDLWELNNNAYGLLHNIPGTGLEPLAQGFVRLGWRARKSAWDEYDVECTWCEINLFSSGGAVKFAGVVDLGRADELAAVFGSLGVDYEIELYDQAAELVRKLRPSP